jgi:hypothetical protein
MALLTWRDLNGGYGHARGPLLPRLRNPAIARITRCLQILFVVSVNSVTVVLKYSRSLNGMRAGSAWMTPARVFDETDKTADY